MGHLGVRIELLAILHLGYLAGVLYRLFDGAVLSKDHFSTFRSNALDAGDIVDTVSH